MNEFWYMFIFLVFMLVFFLVFPTMIFSAPSYDCAGVEDLVFAKIKECKTESKKHHDGCKSLVLEIYCKEK